jgi:acetyl-CoA decarbonylase/synthase complex subunit delta
VAFEIPKIRYSGKIKEITIGVGDKTVTVGGRDCYPFHLFEGSMPHRPIIAMEIWDMEPEGWPEAATEPFKDVISDPPAWAKKCVDEYGADVIVVQLKSTDPNDKDRPADEAAELAKKIVDAVPVPVVFWGTAVNEKDEQVLKKIAEVCEGKNVGLSPVEEPIHKGVGASALGYKHTVVASTPIDVNLAKQLNILLGNLGVPDRQLLNDPTTGGLGYGIEYAYSVMERITQAGLTQEDDKLQIPMINNLGNETWKCKEAGMSKEEMPTMGEPARRAILMEAVGAVCYLFAGSDILIMRHPESIKLAKEMINDLAAEN